VLLRVMRQAWVLREKMERSCIPTMLWGDGAYDSEAWRKTNWEDWGLGTANLSGVGKPLRGDPI